jgi:hypothetical protein
MHSKKFVPSRYSWTLSFECFDSATTLFLYKYFKHVEGITSLCFLLSSSIKEIKYSNYQVLVFQLNTSLNELFRVLFYPSKTFRTKKLLEIVYLDLCSVEIPTPCGCRYFLTLWMTSVECFGYILWSRNHKLVMPSRRLKHL